MVYVNFSFSLFYSKFLTKDLYQINKFMLIKSENFNIQNPSSHDERKYSKKDFLYHLNLSKAIIIALTTCYFLFVNVKT